MRGKEDKVIVLWVFFYVQSFDMEMFLKRDRRKCGRRALFIHY